jgi:septum formation protein
LILASASPARRKLLEAVGLQARVVPARVDERDLQERMGTLGPAEVALNLALAKGREVAGREVGVVIAADQVLWDGQEIVGKPSSIDNHVERLADLRGRWHTLYTGWTVVDPSHEDHGVCTTRLRVREDLDISELRWYAESGEGSGCAGGYAIEGFGGWLFEEVEGDWTNVLGLPLFSVLTSLRRRGWKLSGGPS